MNTRKTREIVIVRYHPKWPQAFQQIAARLAEALGGAALRIDHIGSTSVPGLAAKDIIDVQVTVAELDAAALDPAFARAGCARIAENVEDHAPPTATDNGMDNGMDNGTDNGQEWRKLMYRPSAAMRPAHLHVRRAGSPNGRYALLFRDYLRTHPLAAAAYAQVKQALARHGPTDWDLYYDVKDPVCDIIMAGAEDWAAATGWRLEHYS